MGVDLQACTRQLCYIVQGVYAVINFHAVMVIITCIKQATQFFTYLQMKLLLRTRLPLMHEFTSVRNSFYFHTV